MTKLKLEYVINYRFKRHF